MTKQIDLEFLKASNKSDFDYWKELCNSEPDCDIFFYPEYAMVYELNKEGEACALVCKKKTNDFILYPFLIRKIDQAYLCEKQSNGYFDIVSPYGYAGYYQSHDCSIDINAFSDGVNTFCKKSAIVSEFVRFNPWMGTHKNCRVFMDAFLLQKVVVIDLLKSEDEIWADFDAKNRNRIRKSRKNNVMVKQDTSFAFLDDFYRLYYQTMTKNKALPYYYFKKGFFQNMNCLLKRHVKLYHAFLGKQIIGSLMVINSKKYSHAHLSCSDEYYSNLGHINQLMHEAALDEKKQGRMYFILGGGRTPEKDDTLFHFKKRFSKTLFDFYTGRKIHNEEIYHLLCQKKIAFERKKTGVKFNEMFFPRYRAPEMPQRRYNSG